jgi:hypothetical protein
MDSPAEFERHLYRMAEHDKEWAKALAIFYLAEQVRAVSIELKNLDSTVGQFPANPLIEAVQNVASEIEVIGSTKL